MIITLYYITSYYIILYYIILYYMILWYYIVHQIITLCFLHDTETHPDGAKDINLGMPKSGSQTSNARRIAWQPSTTSSREGGWLIGG